MTRIIAALLGVGLLVFGVYALTQPTPAQSEPPPAQSEPTPAQSEPTPAMAVMVKITCDVLVEETQGNYNGEYTPRNITVPVGTTVTWNNTDVKEHSVISDDGLFSANIGTDETFSYTFTKPGIFVYRDDIYAMSGKVTVEEVIVE
ncbi:MAG: cupredoxin domain-containing protein [Dehalococcoidales bacterium]|nr:cupredoxin domain-containing protein [Dehalococcoidales bacterium]